MTGKELFEYLTQDAGLDEATAKAVAANEKVGTKAAALVQKKEYDDLEAKAAALELTLNGTGKQMGAKAYQEWYQKNYPEIQKLQTAVATYKERYGDLDGAPPPDDKTKKGAGATFTAEDVQRMVAETIDKNYAPRWSDLVTKSGTIVQKHMLAGRKNAIDFPKLAEIAATKGGDLEAAYDEYDRPEREAASKATMDAEIERRVKEGVQKAQTQNLFPAGADGTPSSGTPGITRPQGDKKYDRSAVIAAAVTGEYSGKVQ